MLKQIERQKRAREEKERKKEFFERGIPKSNYQVRKRQPQTVTMGIPGLSQATYE